MEKNAQRNSRIMKNLHSHTQFCDGRATMSEMAEAAFNAGFEIWGTSPHSPISCYSNCNMKKEDVGIYIRESDRLKKLYDGRMKILTGMEVDYISSDFGPHIDYFKKLPLDYRIGSVHFVRTRDGRLVDCDGPAQRFLQFLTQDFNDDLRYVAETYFAMQLEMLEAGGFDIIGHLDKIGDNGSASDPELEDYSWYANLVEEVIANAAKRDIIIEINTKKYPVSGRFFPNIKWWPLLKQYKARVVISTDAHYPDKVSAGYTDALRLLNLHGILPE